MSEKPMTKAELVSHLRSKHGREVANYSPAPWLRETHAHEHRNNKPDHEYRR